MESVSGHGLTYCFLQVSCDQSSSLKGRGELILPLKYALMDNTRRRQALFDGVNFSPVYAVIVLMYLATIRASLPFVLFMSHN